MHSKIVAPLKNAHRMMEHVLTLIRLQVDMLHAKTRQEEFIFLQKALDYMQNFPSLIHHATEELILDRLRSRVPHYSELCKKLTNQHRQFHIMETRLLEFINQAERGDSSVLEPLKKLTHDYCMAQSDHILMEEQEMLPKAVASLTQDDWLDIGCQSNLQIDPLADPDIVKHYDNLYDYIMSTSPSRKSH